MTKPAHNPECQLERSRIQYGLARMARPASSLPKRQQLQTPGLARDFVWIARREILWGLMLLARPGRLTAIGMLAKALPATLRKRRAMSQARQQTPDR